MSQDDSRSCASLEELELLAAGRCADDRLRAHVESCAACKRAADELRANNALLRGFTIARDAPRPAAVPLAVAAIAEVGGYEIVSEIRRGGQGIVYKAIQKATKRPVALKMLLGGPLASTKQRRRFEREVELIASLRHPYIVTLYDSGITADGGHFFAMEYIHGMPLDQYLSPPPGSITGAGVVSIKHVLRLFMKICEAVEFAHQHGIIHRDIKPGNILVDAQGVPHVLDFGLARALGREPVMGELLATQTGEFMGTFAYAAPEQVRGNPDMVDTRTDVYALGVILYEMLTGALPYPVSGSISDVVRHIAEVSPQHASFFNHRIDDELDTILQKALAKDRERRYQTVEALRADVERYLTGAPIDAKRDSTWYVFRKTVRRHRTAAAVAIAFVTLVAVFGVAMAVLANRIARERDRANQYAADLERSVHTLTIESARSAGAAGDLPTGESMLWKSFLLQSPSDAGEAADQLSSLSASPVHWALWELYSREPCVTTWALDLKDVADVTFTPDGKQIVTVGSDGLVNFYTLAGERLRSIGPLGAAVKSVAFGRRTGRLVLGMPDGTVEFRDSTTGALLESHPTMPNPLSLLHVSRDEQTIVSASEQGGTVQIYDVAGRSSRTIAPLAPSDTIRAAVSSDDCWLATSGENGPLEVRPLAGGEPIAALRIPEGPVKSVALSARGEYAAAGAENHTHVLDVASREKWSYSHDGWVNALRFHDEEPMLASTGFDSALRLVDVRTREVLVTYVAAAKWLYRPVLSPDGNYVVASDRVGFIKLWETRPYQAMRPVAHVRPGPLCAALSRDGRTIAVAGCGEQEPHSGWCVSLLDKASGEVPRTLTGHSGQVASLAFSRDGRRLVSADYAAEVRLWDAETGSYLRSFTGHEASVSTVAISSDGRWVASGSEDHTVRLWDAATGACVLVQREHRNRVPAVAFSPDDTLLASAAMDGNIVLCEVPSGVVRRQWLGHPSGIRTVSFSPDGRRLASGGDDRTIRLWDVASGDCLSQWEAHRQHLFSVAFHPEGRLLASAGRGNEIKLWDTTTGRCLATLLGHHGIVFTLSFHPDGRQLVTASNDGTVGLWDLNYYDRHIAGNLEFQIRRVTGGNGEDTAEVEALRAWAGGTLLRPRTPGSPSERRSARAEAKPAE
ncbi:MAG: protein kinase [Planctomycetes bacterium]|nr:protein kinase [Planctomycetota bacterium]